MLFTPFGQYEVFYEDDLLRTPSKINVEGTNFLSRYSVNCQK